MAHRRGTAKVAQHTTVIKDTTVVTIDRDDTILYDAAVAIKDGRVASVGPSREIVARFPGAHVVDGSGKVVMPGFANIHTHFTLIIAKGIYEDLSPPHKPPFTSGLAPLPVPELSRDEMIAMVRLAALEAIRSGTTAALAGILLTGYSRQAYLGMGDPYLFTSIAAVAIGGWVKRQ